MNKIILNIGLLSFFLSLLYFLQRGFALEDILLKSLAVFMFITVMGSIIAIMVIRYINKGIEKERNEMNDNILGENNE